MKRMIVAFTSLIAVAGATDTAGASTFEDQLQLVVPLLGGTAEDGLLDECSGRSRYLGRPALPELLGSLRQANLAPELVREGEIFLAQLAVSRQRREEAIRSCHVTFDRWRLARVYGGSDDAEAVYREVEACFLQVVDEHSIEGLSRTCESLRSRAIRRREGLGSPLPFGLEEGEQLDSAFVDATFSQCEAKDGKIDCQFTSEALERDRGWIGKGNLAGWATFTRVDGEPRLEKIYLYRIGESCSDSALIAAQWWKGLQERVGPTPAASRRSESDLLCAQIPSELQLGNHRFSVGTARLPQGYSGYMAFVEITAQSLAKLVDKPSLEHH